MEDVTQPRAIERALKELLHKKDMLLLEMQHRVVNSLQIIASILLLKTVSRAKHTRSVQWKWHDRAVALQCGGHYIGVELNPDYIQLTQEGFLA